MELIFTKAGTNILSGNAIDFQVAITPYNYLTQKGTVFLIITISQETLPNSGTFSEIKSQKVFPDDSGIVSVDVSSIVDAYLQYFTPPANLDRLIAIPSGQGCRFSVKFSLFSGIDLLTESTKIISTIKGGAAWQYFNTDITYKWQDAATPPMLLFISDGNDVVSVDDLFYIYFTMLPAVASQVFARFTINYVLDGAYASLTDNIDDTIDATPGLSIACLPAGYSQLNIQSRITDGAVPISYSIAIFGIKDGAEIAYFPPVTFTIDQRNFYDAVQLVYRNSLGGLQPLRLLGQVDSNADYTFAQVSRMTPPSYLLDGNIIGQVEQPYSEETQKFIAETGFITKYQADRLRDFFLSKQRYQLQDGRLIPITLNTKAAKFYTNKENLISVSMEWQHAFVNNFFSNKNMPPDACPAINYLTWRQTGTNEITLFYSLPFGNEYARISLSFPDAPLQYYTLEGNAGIRKLSFTRPSAYVGIAVMLTVKGNVICNRYNMTPSYGPDYNVPPAMLTGEQLPIAENDSYTITSGYNTPVNLVGSALANDYDPNGATIEAISATGATASGGTYTIDAAGLISYLPPSSTFVGADSFTYQIRVSPAGTPVTATVAITVGAATPVIYARLAYRNGSSMGYTNFGDVFIDFFNSAFQPISVTSYNLTINLQVNTNGEVSGNAIVATGSSMLIYSGTLSEYDADGQNQLFAISFDLLPGTGYIRL